MLGQTLNISLNRNRNSPRMRLPLNSSEQNKHQRNCISKLTNYCTLVTPVSSELPCVTINLTECCAECLAKIVEGTFWTKHCSQNDRLYGDASSASRPLTLTLSENAYMNSPKPHREDTLIISQHCHTQQKSQL